MHECGKFAELIMVWGSLKTYRCTECEKEWEEKKDENNSKMEFKLDSILRQR